MNQNIPDDAKGVLFIISTSHMDWHWHVTFEQYYNMGSPSSNDLHYSVRYILDQVRTLLPSLVADQPNDISQVPPYQYNLAEIAWLRRYLKDNPDWLPELRTLKGSFSLIGGGITSPDSLVTNGEVFIRNYLVGRNYARQMGLEQLLTNVCWVPDDFGTDPQLPVVLQAMGFNGVSFARIPGWQQGSGSEPLDSYFLPQDNSVALSKALAQDGVTFYWKAADKSTVLANFMVQYSYTQPQGPSGLPGGQNPGYGFPWGQSGSSADVFNVFITANQYPEQNPTNPKSYFKINEPGQIMMTPTGGDFSVPTEVLPQAVADYNNNYYLTTGSDYNGTGICAVLGTFEDFVKYMIAKSATGAFKIPVRKGWEAANQGFDPSSYWSGHFANLVQLKISQQRTSNRLLAAETLSTLLRAWSCISSATLDSIDEMISVAWNTLVPSSHHDYITGTSPNSIYRQEQLPMITLAQDQAEQVLRRAMGLLAMSVNASPNTNEVPYVVFNPAGTERTVNRLVEIPHDKTLVGMNSYYLAGNTDALFPIQHLANGGILIQVEELYSTGYTIVYFSPAAPNQTIVSPAQKSADDAAFYMSNGAVQIAIGKSQTGGWALTSIYDLSTNAELTSGPCNSIQVYSEGSHGNPYQMGNEVSRSADGFQPDQNASYTISSGMIVESGPYRWKFQGEMANTLCPGSTESSLTVEYMLNLLEPMVNIRVEGNAPDTQGTNYTGGPAYSVVSNWSVAGAPAKVPAMKYGTANHWNDENFTAYWPGIVFRSTHDYLTLINDSDPNGNPLAAVYHEGMRAWGFDSGLLTGILFRNTGCNGGRGALNSDTDTHVQNFAFRIPGVTDPSDGQPLKESMQFQHPLEAVRIQGSNSDMAIMKAPGYLAYVSGNAIIRMARTQAGSGGYPTNQSCNKVLPTPFSFVLRIYQPSNIKDGMWTLHVPFIADNHRKNPALSFVTALEEEIKDAPVITGSSPQNFSSLNTLNTIRIQSFGRLITPSNP